MFNYCTDWIYATVLIFYLLVGTTAAVCYCLQLAVAPPLLNILTFPLIVATFHSTSSSSCSSSSLCTQIKDTTHNVLWKDSRKKRKQW